MPRNSTKKAERKSKKPPLVLRSFDRSQYETTNPRVMEYLSKKRNSRAYGAFIRSGDLEDVKALIEELEIADPETGSRNWTRCEAIQPYVWHQIGASAENAMDLYLRRDRTRYLRELPQRPEIGG
jgi:glycyl-tRNA synthetase